MGYIAWFPKIRKIRETGKSWLSEVWACPIFFADTKKAISNYISFWDGLFIIVCSNSLQLITISYLPMHQAYIIEYQRLFILKGTSCIMTIKRSRKENVRRLHSVAFAYGLVPPFSVFLWNVLNHVQWLDWQKISPYVLQNAWLLLQR